jgi:hypothetical protein
MTRAAAIAAGWLACAALGGGCGDARTSSKFEQRDAGDAGAQLRASWKYRSPEVDVDIELVTADASDGCTTTARLRVDEALAGTDVYRLPPTDCAQLRLGEDGDLILLDSPTGHDWSAEPLDVDGEREAIRLGPWHDAVRAISYRFALSAPECSDDPGCDCPRLERRAGDELTSLSFRRRCD